MATNLLQLVLQLFLAIVLSVPFRYTDSDNPFGIFKLFFLYTANSLKIVDSNFRTLKKQCIFTDFNFRGSKKQCIFVDFNFRDLKKQCIFVDFNFRDYKKQCIFVDFNFRDLKKQFIFVDSNFCGFQYS